MPLAGTLERKVCCNVMTRHVNGVCIQTSLPSMPSRGFRALTIAELSGLPRQSPRQCVCCSYSVTRVALPMDRIVAEGCAANSSATRSKAPKGETRHATV